MIAERVEVAVVAGMPAQEAALDLEIERLVVRLTRGFEVIESAREAGEQVDEWEDTWIRLLHRYERLMELRAA